MCGMRVGKQAEVKEIRLNKIRIMSDKGSKEIGEMSIKQLLILTIRHSKNMQISFIRPFLPHAYAQELLDPKYI